MDAHSFVTGAYLTVLAALGAYGAHRLALLARFRWVALERSSAAPEEDPPAVTVQLPLYDERTVAARIVRCVGALDYPPGRLEIQVLDDSGDETAAIVDREVAALVERGLDARVLRRARREGFKAGALAHGLRHARGALICVFDADFMPLPDFLRQLVPAFRDPRIGMVQARWGHANRDETLLTRAQSTLLDGHFVVEHATRHAQGLFFNFNGTAGIWRRSAIEDGGGWRADTLTEDLDLSYRAQLAGWRFAYAPSVVAPAEVPADIAAFKSQQHRWTKGSVQVLRKLAGPLATSHQPARVKLEAFAHLTGNVGYPLVLALALLLPLAAGVRREGVHLWHLGAFVTCTLSVLAFYETSQRVLGRARLRRSVDSLAAVALGIGMSLGQTLAVLEGLAAGTGVFERTPKRGSGSGSPGYRARPRGVPGAELLLALWLAWGMLAAARVGNWGSLPFLALFGAGYAWVGALSLSGLSRDRLRVAPVARAPTRSQRGATLRARAAGRRRS